MKWINRLREPWVLILIGPPMVGKSTFIKNYFSEITHTVISRDQIVMDVAQTEDYNWAFNNVDQKLVDSVLHDRLTSAAELGENVIIDMTNLSSKRRKYNLKFFGDDYYKVGVIFTIPEWEELERRNKVRTEIENKTIPMHVVKNMISSYQPIREDEPFDKIVSI
jgi:predicted kinase